MQQFRQLIQQVLDEGAHKNDRTATGTTSIFNANASFNLKQGFPLVTGKKTSFKNVAAELLWFLSGSTNIKDLHKDGCHIWDEWARPDGSLGKLYGHQWRKAERHIIGHSDTEEVTVTTEYVDQIQNMLDLLKNDPDSRRMVVDSWNVADLPDMALAPCHHNFQFYTKEANLDWRVDWYKKHIDKDTNMFLSMGGIRTLALLDKLKVPSRLLSCKITQRSCDLFLGVPYNIASYALLVELVAHCTNMIADTLHWSGGDTHIYDNHTDQIAEYMSRKIHRLPKLVIPEACPTNLFDIRLNDFTLDDYKSGAYISAPVAV